VLSLHSMSPTIHFALILLLTALMRTHQLFPLVWASQVRTLLLLSLSTPMAALTPPAPLVVPTLPPQRVSCCLDVPECRRDVL